MEQKLIAWRKKPGPESLKPLLEASDSVLDSALRSYAGGDQSLRTQAKLLMLRGMKSFDSKRGVQLKTHLMNQLKPLQRLHLERSQPVDVPERMVMDSRLLHRTEQEYIDKYNREPNAQELAEESGLSLRRIAAVRTGARPFAAESISGEGVPGKEEDTSDKIWTEYVHFDADPIDKKIIEWKTGLYSSPILENQEIARRLKLSPGAISQRSSKIAAKLAEGLPE